jgi:hypothetical protein
MAESKSDASGNADNSAAGNTCGRPDVIVEFLFDCGAFHIAIRNIGDGPALGISVKFSRKFTGVDGRKEFWELPLFKNIEFLGPGREIITFLDTSHSYFRRKQPAKLSAHISYRDSADRKFETTIKHDLEIYREIVYLTHAGRDCVNDTD